MSASSLAHLAQVATHKGGLPEALPVRCQGLPCDLDGSYAARVLPADLLCLLNPPDGRCDALGEGSQVVAALEDERGGRGPYLMGQGGERGGEASEGGGLQRHASQRIGPVGVVARGDQDQSRTELAQHGEQDPGERRRVETLARARGQRHVHGQADSFALPYLVGPTGSRVERALVRREVEHLPILVEDVLGTVAVVDVPVENGYPPYPAREGVACADRGVVEQAEPHPRRPPGVVARRARYREGRLPRERALDRRDGGPAGQRRRLPGMLVEGRVQAQVARSLSGKVLQMVKVGGVVDPRQCVFVRGATGAPLNRHPLPLRPLD